MKAIIFDFDGVIVDSERHWDREQNAIYGSLMPGWKPEYIGELTGLSIDDSHTHLVHTHGLTLSLQEYKKVLDSFVFEIYRTHATLIPGVEAFILQLAEIDLPIAIASSSRREWIETALERFGLIEYFESIVTADDVGGRAKPKPDVYLLAAKHLQAQPHTCIAIEDSRNGITAAKAAGMQCMGLRTPWNAHQDLSAADHIIEHFSDLSPSIPASPAG